MLETKTKNIGDREFSTTQLPGRRSLALKFRLITKIGPAIATLLSGADLKPGENLKLDMYSIGLALEKIGINADEFVALMLEVLCSTSIKTDHGMMQINESVFDMEFGGDLLLAYKAALWALEVNYGESFFGKSGIGSMIQGLSKGTAAASDESSPKN